MFRWLLNRSEWLMEKGDALIEEGDFDGALRVAEKLEKRRFSSAFEIAALAHAGKGDLEAAIAILERGVEKAPDVWINWQLLGNYRSDLDRYDDAEQAFARAMECPGVWSDSVRLNRAILAGRRRRFGDALGLLGEITDGALEAEVAASRVSALNELGRHAEAREVAERALERSDDGTTVVALDGLTSEAVVARRALGDSTGEARAFAVDAVGRYGPGPRLLTQIRELDDTYSETARYYRLLIHGTLAQEDPRFAEVKGFYSTVDIVADSVDEALTFFRSVERRFSLATLEADKVEDLEPRPEHPKGVYDMSGYSLYEAE